jgi:hypothetical protein
MARLSDDDEAAFLLGGAVAVESSAVAAARYDADARTLFVRFTGGPTWYTYPGVGWGTARLFAEAESKGKFLAKHFPRPWKG